LEAETSPLTPAVAPESAEAACAANAAASARVVGKARTALKWAALGRFSGQAISWASTLVVMRLLAPTDYGLMALASTFTAFIFLFNELGLGASIINNPDMEHQDLQAVFGLVILSNLILAGVLCGAATFIADFYEEPRLKAIILVLSAQFVLLSLSVVPQAVLERNLDFKKVSAVQFVKIICGSVVTLVLAYRGLGVWALVFGSLAMALTQVVGVNALNQLHITPSFRVRRVVRYIRYGASVATTRVLWFFYARFDVLLIGKLLGGQMLGYYAVGSEIASLPMAKVSGIINQVAFPAFSQLKERPDEIAVYLVKAARVMAFLAFPILWGMSSVAPEAIALVLGDKWLPAVLPCQILCLVIPFRMVSNLTSPANLGAGRPDISLTNLLIACAVMPVTFLVGSRWGLVGVCLAWLVGYLPVFAVMTWRTFSSLGASAGTLFLGLSRIIASASVMYVCVLCLRVFLGPHGSLLQRLVLLSISGAAVYPVAVWILDRDVILATRGLFRNR